MSEDSDHFEEDIKSKQKRPRRDDGRKDQQKFESGSEEEYVIGNITAQKKD